MYCHAQHRPFKMTSRDKGGEGAYLTALEFRVYLQTCRRVLSSMTLSSADLHRAMSNRLLRTTSLNGMPLLDTTACSSRKLSVSSSRCSGPSCFLAHVSPIPLNAQKLIFCSQALDPCAVNTDSRAERPRQGEAHYMLEERQKEEREVKGTNRVIFEDGLRDIRSKTVIQQPRRDGNPRHQLVLYVQFVFGSC